MAEENKELQLVAKEWLMARKIIADALQEIAARGVGVLSSNRELHEKRAAAIIARLAGNDPPILLEVCKEEL